VSLSVHCIYSNVQIHFFHFEIRDAPADKHKHPVGTPSPSPRNFDKIDGVTHLRVRRKMQRGGGLYESNTFLRSCSCAYAIFRLFTLFHLRCFHFGFTSNNAFSFGLPEALEASSRRHLKQAAGVHLRSLLEPIRTMRSHAFTERDKPNRPPVPRPLKKSGVNQLQN